MHLGKLMIYFKQVQISLFTVCTVKIQMCYFKIKLFPNNTINAYNEKKRGNKNVIVQCNTRNNMNFEKYNIIVMEDALVNLQSQTAWLQCDKLWSWFFTRVFKNIARKNNNQRTLTIFNGPAYIFLLHACYYLEKIS